MNPKDDTFPGITLRPMSEADRPFLRQLYASIREPELRDVNWSEQEQRQFLDLQFQAQHHHYVSHYADADFDIIELRGQPVGRLYVHRGQSDIRIMDIALMPEVRGHGLGTWLLEQLIAEASAVGRELTIHVESQNPALRLYRRLGFQPRSKGDVYLLLAWSPVSGQEQAGTT